MTVNQCKCCSSKDADPRWPELERILEPYRGNTGALIQALHKAQELFGFVSPEVQEKVAEVLNVPLSEIGRAHV